VLKGVAVCCSISDQDEGLNMCCSGCGVLQCVAVSPIRMQRWDAEVSVLQR